MLRSIYNLTCYVYSEILSVAGYTTSQIIVSLLFIIVPFVGQILWRYSEETKTENAGVTGVKLLKEVIKKHVKQVAFRSIIFYVLCFFLLLSWSTVHFIYKDHKKLLSRIAALRQEKKQLESEKLSAKFVSGVNYSKLEKGYRLALFSIDIKNLTDKYIEVKDYQGEIKFDGQMQAPLTCLALPDDYEGGVNVNGNIWHSGHYPPHGIYAKGSKNGVILFRVEDKLNKLEVSKSEWILSFKDDFGKSYTISTNQSILSTITSTAAIRPAILCTSLTGSSPYSRK